MFSEANVGCRYNVNGFVEELPPLPKARRAHACTSLPNQVTGISLSGKVNHPGRSLHPPTVQGFVVAGGSYGSAAVESYTSSVVTRVFPCISNSELDITEIFKYLT